DSTGYVIEPEGFTREGLAFVMELKNVKRGRIHEYTKFSKTAKYFAGERPWNAAKADLAFPSATQNEINKENAEQLVANGVFLVSEGANMPSTNEAIEIYHANKFLYGPAKAANAGGVAVSGLEMSQNSMRLSWTREEVDAKLLGIMQNIFKNCAETAEEFGAKGNFQLGANIAGFKKVADSMLDQGCC
ncbi:Glutamate dehydrogenase, partial [Aduncisulcus paluster]